MVILRGLGGVKKPPNHEIEQPVCLDPSPASWSRNPATRGQGAGGGGGGRQTLNPKPCHAKGGLGAGHPLAEYVKKADVR